MQNQKLIGIVLSIFLIVTCTAGCGDLFSTKETTNKTVYTNPAETTLDFKDKSVRELLGISLDLVQSLRLIRMGDGLTVIVDDKAQIGRILDRLSQVTFSKDLGTQGYTPDGFFLEFTCKDQNDLTKVGIQLDTAKLSFIGIYKQHIYQIIDRGSDTGDDLNTFLDEAQYK